MDRMVNSEVVSRSQLLLQYLLAIHLTFRVAGTAEHSPERLQGLRHRRRYRMLGLIATLAYVIFVLVTVALVWAIREFTEAARKDCEWEPWTNPHRWRF